MSLATLLPLFLDCKRRAQRSHMNRPSQVYKDLAFCENPLEREQEVEDVKVEKVQSLQEVSTLCTEEIP